LTADGHFINYAARNRNRRQTGKR